MYFEFDEFAHECNSTNSLYLGSIELFILFKPYSSFNWYFEIYVLDVTKVWHIL